MVSGGGRGGKRLVGGGAGAGAPEKAAPFCSRRLPIFLLRGDYVDRCGMDVSICLLD